jgi:hypothetical protein
MALFVNHFKVIYKKAGVKPIEDVYINDVFQEVTGIPTSAHALLEAEPTVHEIFRALMTLGADKAVGPDGFSARLIQEKWSNFGPAVLKEVGSFFASGHMPSHIGRSNLVLISKIDDVVQVTDFRPISVCNVIYKLISKILTLRLKPFIGSCISRAQSAFIPGREISENVILLREVLHSFGLPSYKNKEFCLKVDLSKPFDRMDWDFIRLLMPIYNFPLKFAKWVMGCIESAQFTIVLNGKGDGFLRPASGLRQGCSLSPYIFILGMDVLSRSLEYRVKTGALREVRLAPSAQPLTDCLYADDLLIFGTANREEAKLIIDTLQDFSEVSGQRVGPQKSSIWYSAVTPDADREVISALLMVPSNAQCSSYLGAPIQTNRNSFDFLIEKISKKLQMWKSAMLSPAGRLVLIRTVLLALPIYYMATCRIPKAVLNEITSVIRRFFWGKVDKQRYLAFVSWEKILQPVEMGGLGVRDLEAMNESMLMKFLWRIAAGSDALWVQIVKEKYFPKSALWHSKRDYKCTGFWRSIMNLRGILQPWVHWRLGGGDVCGAFAQPWFQGALDCKPTEESQRRLLVRDLVDVENGSWDVDRLTECFGYTNCLEIIANVVPPTPGATGDSLIFKKTSNGSYMVKAGYDLVREPLVNMSVGTKELWKIVWTRGEVLPRIRMFLWKLIHKAIPLATIMQRRFPSVSPLCANCGSHEEDVLHLLHQCHFARACYLAGPIGLRTDGLSWSLIQVLQGISDSLDDEQWLLYVNLAWAIWRCRNDRIYGGKQPEFSQFMSYLNSVNWESKLGSTRKFCGLSGRVLQQALTLSETQNEFYCYSDGSWMEGWYGGIGLVLWHNAEMILYKSKVVRGCCPLQIEAIALKESIVVARNQGIESCSFFSDCLSLVRACSSPQPPMDADWSSFDEIMDI